VPWAAAGNPNITSELLSGKKIGDQTFQVHLDGYKVKQTWINPRRDVERTSELRLERGCSY
jgi:hypothetical protein